MTDPPSTPPGDPPYPYSPPPQYPPGGYVSYPESSGAMTALVLSILGVVACQILAPVGWYLGQKELDAIDAGRRDPNKRDLANAARIVGIIGTVIVGLIILAIVGFVVFAIVIGGTTG